MHQYYLHPLAAPVVIDSLEEPYESPLQAARIAHAVTIRKEAQRDFALEMIEASAEYSGNKTATRLLSILDRQDTAHAKLATIGYDSLRHLQANGLTLAEIAMDTAMNLLDLMAFAAKHPDAVEHAKLDMLACADYKVAEWARDIAKAPRSKEEADNRKVQYTALQDMCKRMSAEWAQFAQRDNELAKKGNMMAINIHLNANLEQQPVRTRKPLENDELPAIEGEVVKTDDDIVEAEFIDQPISQVKVEI